MAASRRVLRIRASAPLPLLRRASAPLPPLHGAALLRRLCTPSTATGGRLSGALDPSASEGAIVGADEGAFLQSESPTHARFVNMMMMHGKKQIARNILRGAFEMLSSAGHDPQHVFLAALDNARPALEMRTMARLQVPYPLNPRRAEMYAMKWIIGAARGRKMKGAPPHPEPQDIAHAEPRRRPARLPSECAHTPTGGTTRCPRGPTGGMKAKLYHELLQVVPRITRRSLASALPPPHSPLLHPPPHPTPAAHTRLCRRPTSRAPRWASATPSTTSPWPTRPPPTSAGEPRPTRRSAPWTWTGRRSGRSACARIGATRGRCATDTGRHTRRA